MHGKPREFVVHFPLKARIESLLTCKEYVRSVKWEHLHHKHRAGHVTDVYDCAWWREKMGVERGGKLTRMGFVVCVDAIPAFNSNHKGSVSLMPAELMNLSLPPHLRYDPDNMMVWMLIPADMSATAQRKYFKFVISTELNPLQTRGVSGPDGPVHIKLFGASLDLKGKEKFYDQVPPPCLSPPPSPSIPRRCFCLQSNPSPFARVFV